jgi:adenosylcobinamide-GDP ribazoletransferase
VSGAPRPRDIAAAFALLTRLPVPRAWAEGVAPARCIWAYPLVGAAVGAAGGAVYALGRAAGLSAALAAVWALAAVLLATGALHEDGLADTADAFGGGRTREQRLAILRDSRIGAFGALALLVSSAMRITAVAAQRPGAAAAALIGAGALGRAALLVPLLLLAPARAEGLGASLARTEAALAMLGLAAAAAIALAVLPWRPALAAMACALVAGGGTAWWAGRRIGGYTGDVLGATSVIAECLVLGLLSTQSG